MTMQTELTAADTEALERALRLMLGGKKNARTSNNSSNSAIG